MLRLNVGCGNRRKEGYLNVDKYDSGADRIMPADVLQFSTETVDEIYSSHMLEHVSKFEVSKILTEWNRVLKVGGKLELEIPDLEWVCRNWLSKPDRERWGFYLDTIFGLEVNEGEFHKTGFTKERIRWLLTSMGFAVDSVEAVWSHDQWCILVRATKIKEGSDEVFILDCYPNNTKRTQMLRDQIIKLKSFGIAIALVTHLYPIPEDIYAMVDYVIYDKRNVKSDTWDLRFTYVKPGVVKMFYPNPAGLGYHGVACYSSLKNGIDFLSNRYKFGHFIEYDVDIDVKKYLQKVRKVRREGKRFIGFQYPELTHPELQKWGGKPTGVVTGVFSFDLDLMRSMLVEVPDWHTWEVLDPEQDVWGISLVFEIWFYNFLNQRLYREEQFYFSREEEAQIVREFNGYNIEGRIHFLISETQDHKLVLFAINIDPVEKEFEWEIYGKWEKRRIGPSDVYYEFIGKLDGGKIAVKAGKYENEWIIDKNVEYSRNKFLFCDRNFPKCVEWDPKETGDFLT